MLGTALLELCNKRGIEAVGTTRQEADICNYDELKVKALEINPTHIINCAAYTDVDGAESNPDAAFAVNSEGAANVARVAAELFCRLVHISTDYVFDGLGTLPYVEIDACAPVNVYGKSKLEGEKRVIELLPTACVMRTSWLFGSRGKNFISSLLNLFQQKEELRVATDHSGKPTYCYDAASAALALLNAEGIVHFASEEGASRFEIACEILKAAKSLGIDFKCQKIIPDLSSQFPTIARRPSYSVLDTTRYCNITLLKPRPWREATREFLNAEFKV